MKQLAILNCSMCPAFRPGVIRIPDGYGRGSCIAASRVVDYNQQGIPDWCPLPDIKEG